jgi:tetratricopeptide (TPR) repeat protein
VNLEPISLETNRMLGLVLLHARRYEEAIEQFQATLELDPRYYIIHVYLSFVHWAKGRYPEARRAAEQARSLAPGEPLCEALLGWALAVTGERAAAVRILDELRERRLRGYCSAVLIGWVHSGLGQPEEAFRWFETAIEDRDLMVVTLGVFPLADPLRTDPRFQQLLLKIGLPHGR